MGEMADMLMAADEAEHVAQWMEFSDFARVFFRATEEKQSRFSALHAQRHGYLVCHQDRYWWDAKNERHHLAEMSPDYLRNVLGFARRYQYTRPYFSGSKLETRILKLLGRSL